MTDTKLQFIFNTENGKTYSIYVDEPVEDYNVSDLNDFIESILNKDIIAGKNGKLTSIKEVRLVTRTVTPIDLEA